MSVDDFSLKDYSIGNNSNYSTGNFLENFKFDASFVNSILSIIAIFIIIILATFLIAYIYEGITKMKIYRKAGHKNPWASWIPVYRLYVLAEVSGYPGWVGLIVIAANIIPGIGNIASLVLLIMIYHNLSRSFGKDIGYTIGLTLLNPIFFGILAFGSSEYVGPNGDSTVVPEWSVNYNPGSKKNNTQQTNESEKTEENN